MVAANPIPFTPSKSDRYNPMQKITFTTNHGTYLCVHLHCLLQSYSTSLFETIAISTTFQCQEQGFVHDSNYRAILIVPSSAVPEETKTISLDQDAGISYFSMLILLMKNKLPSGGV